MLFIGHRGVAALRPENTLASFKKAFEMGLTWVEFDAQYLSDGNWIIMHDNTLDRTTNGTGIVLDKTFGELEKLDAGSWFHKKYKNEKILKLYDLLIYLKSLNLHPNIEIKDFKITNLENAVTDLLKILKNIQCDEYLISSFKLNFLLKLRQKNSTMPIGYLKEKFHDNDISIAKKNKFSTLIYDYKNISENEIIKVQKNQIKIFAFTSEILSKMDINTIKQLPYNKLDGLFVDQPL